MAYRWINRLTRDNATPRALWTNRRALMAGTGALGLSALTGTARAQGMEPTSLENISTYNNFYEFGTGKEDPARHAAGMVTQPWTIKVDGLVDNPGDYALADLIGGLTVEERIYRFRCVEAWSMVVPWNGIELADVLNRVGAQAGARYVAFETDVQPEVMPGVQRQVIPFPYVEGLRIDEAMHPLTLLATGIWGQPMPNQNGAPIRVVVPWKYGFKSIKSIIRLTLQQEMPPTTWNLLNAGEYGFYSNVNPTVDHPRWSQATDRPIGGGLFAGRVDTPMFNGYESEVASLYEGMDLRANY